MAGKRLAAAAAAAEISERAARKCQSGPLPSTAKAPRWWRTREDPFADVWQSEVVPQLVADTDGRLQVLTLFKALCRRHPGRFQPGQLRTLQRRVREWRVQYGPDREVYFEQVPVPGREAAFDFTDLSDLGVTLVAADRAYVDFAWIDSLVSKGLHLVTRLNSPWQNSAARRNGPAAARKRLGPAGFRRFRPLCDTFLSRVRPRPDAARLPPRAVKRGMKYRVVETRAVNAKRA